jgi:hypothetical protein
MPALILTIAGCFGISPLRLIIYAVAVVAGRSWCASNTSTSATPKPSPP